MAAEHRARLILWYVALVSVTNHDQLARGEELDPLHLKATVEALREALNQASREREGAIADSRRSADAEIAELQSTVRALREALEAVNQGHVKKQAELEAKLAAERRELESTIRTMRDQLEPRR